MTPPALNSTQPFFKAIRYPLRCYWLFEFGFRSMEGLQIVQNPSALSLQLWQYSKDGGVGCRGRPTT